jgi:hypothetical protein
MSHRIKKNRGKWMCWKYSRTLENSEGVVEEEEAFLLAEGGS